MRPSQLSWVAHWRQVGSVNKSRDHLELPYLGVSTEQDSGEGLPRGLDQNQFKKLKVDSCKDSSSKWKVVQRNGRGSLEVLPMLLQPAERLGFGCNKNTDGLFELVARSQKVILQTPAERAVQSQCLAPSVSPANLGTPMDPCPVFLSDNAVVSSFLQKDTAWVVVPRECSLIHGSGSSSFRAFQACEDKLWPWPLRDATGRELNIVGEESDVRFTDLVNQSHQMEKTTKKGFVFDAKIDKNELAESTSGLLMPAIPVPIEMNIYEDKSRLGSSRETHKEKLSNSIYCWNRCYQKGSCSTLPYTEKKVSMVDRTSKQFIYSLVGNFLSSTFIQKEGKIIESFSGLEFSGPIKDSHEYSKFLAIPHRINLDPMPSCSIRDAGTLRISTAVDKVERVPGKPSKFSKTNHFLITKKRDMTVSREDQLAGKPSSDAENYRNAFPEMADFCSLSHLCDKKDIKTKAFSKSSRSNPLNEDFCYHFRPSGDAESGLPSNSTRGSSPKYGDNNDAQASSAEACFEQPHAAFVSKETFAGISPTAGQNHLYLNTLLPRNSSNGWATDMNDKDSREAEAAYERLWKITTLEKETKFGNMDSNMSTRVGDLRSCLDVNGSNEKKGICTLKAKNPSADIQDRPVCQSSDFSVTASGQDIRWVKRLKDNNSEAFGTKSTILGYAFPEQKRAKLLNRAGYDGRFFSSSDFISNPWIKKQTQEFARMTMSRQSKSAAELLNESKLILSSPWLRRLRPREGQAKQTGSVELTGEPARCPKLALEMQSKESPTSLGAMALLGKGMRNFSKCGSSKKGSSMVWKTGE